MNRQHHVLLTISILVLMGLVYSMGFAQEEPPKRTAEEVVAIIEGNPGDYYLPRIETTNAPSLPDLVEGTNPPDWSRLAFESARDGNWEIYLIDSDSTDEHRLTNDPAIDIYPSLVHGGAQVLFSSNQTGTQEIYRANSDGTNVVQLTNNGATNLTPTLSRDGSKVVFRSSISGNPDVFVMNADGTALTQLTFAEDFDGMPDWSSDGSRIVFTSNRTGTYTLWVMNADGSGQVPLNIGFEAVYPKWSPLDERIAFAGDSNGDGFYEVWMINSDSSNLQQMVYGYTGGDNWFPAWSPDGEWLAYSLTSWYVYQGVYYWSTSALHALKLDQENGYVQIPIAQYDNQIWRSFWASKDATPPEICSVTTSPEQKSSSFIVSMAAQDGGDAGIKTYDLEARWGSNLLWQTVTINTPFSNAIVSEVPAGQVDFRCRAHDNAGNVAPWPDTPSITTKVDVFRPESWMTTNSHFVQGTSTTVQWAGQDREGEIAGFDIFVKDGNEGNWTLWQDDTLNFSAVFNGAYGHMYFFRSQATDEVGHVESWKPVPDISVTFYDTQLSGIVTDARGNFLSQPVFQTEPLAGEVVVEPITGYQLYLSDAVTHTLTITASGFAPLDATVLETLGDATLDWVLTSETERSINGDFETGGLDGWAVSGAGAETSLTALHSGQYGVQFEQIITETSQITQSVIIPIDEHEPTLSFLYQLPSNIEQGNFEVIVQGITSLPVLSTTTSTDGWIHAWTDLSDFSGETITLIFRFDGIGIVKVDEISVSPWESPLIESVSPTEIPGWEESSLVITGQNFIQFPAVFLNDIQLIDIQWDGPGQFIAIVPAGFERGTYDLEVRNPNGAIDVLPQSVSVTWNLTYLPIIVNNANSSFNLNIGAADWPTLGQNNAHTGVNTNDPGASRYTLAWSFPLPASQYFGLESLAVADGTLVVINNQGLDDEEITSVYALNAGTGTELWQYSFAENVQLNPATIAHGTIYFQQTTGEVSLIALDLDSGLRYWQSPFVSQSFTFLPPVITASKAFIAGGQSGGIYAYDAGNGKPLWFSYFPAQDDWTPAFYNNRLFAFTDNLFRELNPDTGETLWTKALSYSDVWGLFTTTVIADNIALLANGNGLYAVNINTHQLKWSINGDFYKSIPTTDSGLVYSLKEGKLQVRNISDGSLVWNFDGDGLLTHAPVIAGNYLYIASPENTYVLDRTTHQVVWQIDRGGWLAVANGFLYIGSPEKTIYAYRAQEP